MWVTDPRFLNQKSGFKNRAIWKGSEFLVKLWIFSALGFNTQKVEKVSIMAINKIDANYS